MPILAAGAGSLTTWGLLLGAVALLALWGQGRRRAMGGTPRRTVPLGGGQALHVVELEGRRLVIGTGPGSAPRLLTELGACVGSESLRMAAPWAEAPREGSHEDPREGSRMAAPWVEGSRMAAPWVEGSREGASRGD